MPGLIIAALIIAYTGFVIFKRIRSVKAGKSCCTGCSSCAYKNKCGSI